MLGYISFAVLYTGEQHNPRLEVAVASINRDRAKALFLTTSRGCNITYLLFLGVFFC